MSFIAGLNRFFIAFALVFLGCIGMAAWMEHVGVSRQWIGYYFIFITFSTYAVIGLLSRTSDHDEYFLANRAVPWVYNGMATAADWVSAASFLGLIGALFFNGYNALALVLGWVAGFVLMVILVAPYLRKFRYITLGDFLADRYAGGDQGRLVRLIYAALTLSISFVYVVAQIDAVGLIVSRFAGVEFGIGVFFGLAGVLLCSFLGGMRAVTWTAVAQCIVMMISIVVMLLALFFVSGHSKWSSVSEAVRVSEMRLMHDKKERQVQDIYRQEAQRYALLIQGLPQSWVDGYEARRKHLELARYDGSTFQQIKDAERVLNEYPSSSSLAKRQWMHEFQRLSDLTPRPQTEALNVWHFLAVVLTLMCGTLALPHVVVRFFTTPTASQARWSSLVALGCMVLVYWAAPWFAVLAKNAVFEHLVGMDFSKVPNWIAAWSRVMPNLATLQDVNQDGIVQYAEIGLNADVLILVASEIAGMPFFLCGMLAAGGLAAALSTADGLLLTIAAALSHDVYHKVFRSEVSAQRRVIMSKIVLLCVALLAVWVTSLQPGSIVGLVGAAFALSASSLAVPVIAGIFWKRATRLGALWAMLLGGGSSMVCLLLSNPTVMVFWGLEPWGLFGFSGLASGVLTIPVSLMGMIFGSLIDKQAGCAEALFEGLHRPEARSEK
jgi:cation/acetate symporter